MAKRIKKPAFIVLVLITVQLKAEMYKLDFNMKLIGRFKVEKRKNKPRETMPSSDLIVDKQACRRLR